MPKIKLEGMEKLQVKLKKNVQMSDVKRVVKENGAQMQEKMQRKANFKKGYQTGTTKRSIGMSIKDGGMTAEAGPTTEYSPYLEHGTDIWKRSRLYILLMRFRKNSSNPI